MNEKRWLKIDGDQPGLIGEEFVRELCELMPHEQALDFSMFLLEFGCFMEMGESDHHRELLGALERCGIKHDILPESVG